MMRPYLPVEYDRDRVVHLGPLRDQLAPAGGLRQCFLGLERIRYVLGDMKGCTETTKMEISQGSDEHKTRRRRDVKGHARGEPHTGVEVPEQERVGDISVLGVANLLDVAQPVLFVHVEHVLDNLRRLVALASPPSALF